MCIRSEERVWLPQQNRFRSGSLVTMPDLADRKDKCTDEANPGIVARETHMMLPDMPSWIQRTYDAFSDPFEESDLEARFFDTRRLGDLTPLIDAGLVDPENLPSKGDMLTLTKDAFESVPALPSGLIYTVSCKKGGQHAILNLDALHGQMDDAVLLTPDCSIHFGDGARATGAPIVTMRERNNATVTAGSSVVVADPTKSCIASERTIVMSVGKVSVPAEFVMSNVTLVTADDVDIASATPSGISSEGLSIYAKGRVSISSQHEFRVCGNPASDLVPQGTMLRLVPPPGAVQAALTL
jgi:hypothetical protein